MAETMVRPLRAKPKNHAEAHSRTCTDLQQEGCSAWKETNLDSL